MIEHRLVNTIRLLLKLKTNVLIDGKCFFEIPIKKQREAYEKIIEINKNNEYTTGNLLEYDYISKHCRLIAIDLSKQIELEKPDPRQQINFIGKLKRNEGATMFFIIEKSEETTFNFSQNLVNNSIKWKLKIVNLLNYSSN